MGRFLIPMFWLILQQTILLETAVAQECHYDVKFPNLTGAVFTVVRNTNISLEFDLSEAQCPKKKLTTVTVDKIVINHTQTAHDVFSIVCKIVVNENGKCVRFDENCTCFSEKPWVYKLTKIADQSDNTTWRFWVDKPDTGKEVTLIISEEGVITDSPPRSSAPQDSSVSKGSDEAAVITDGQTGPGTKNDEENGSTSGATATDGSSAKESSGAQVGLGVAFALAVLIAVAVFVYDRFWKEKGNQDAGFPGKRSLTAVSRYVRGRLNHEYTPDELANHPGDRQSVCNAQSRCQDSPVTRTQRHSKCRSAVTSENLYWEINPDEIYSLENVAEDDQTEDDDEEAVMIVNSLYAGGDMETKKEPVKLTDYEDVADAKGREGETRPVSASQPAAASSASEPGAATEGYIDFNVTLDGDCHTQRGTRGRLLSSESGAANGEYVGLSKVLEMNSHQKDEDAKK